MSAKKKKRKNPNSSGNVRKLERRRTVWDKIIAPIDSDNFFLRNVWFLVAFIVPAAMMYIMFAFPDLFMSKASLEGVDVKTLRVEPFGNQQILVTDLWHQYYPFLVDFHTKLREGGSMLFTWSSGGGVNYLALISYYLASPLNLLSIFVDPENLREFLTVITCAKIGFASLLFAQFIRIIFKKRDASVAAFGIMYAACAFVTGYYWNIIWLDTFALLPLVVAGTICVLKERKFKLYVISLALAILTNYYIALFICIFIVLVSISYCIIEYTNFKDLMMKFVRMVGYSSLAIGISAMLALPAFFALMSTQSSSEMIVSTSNTPPEGWALYLTDYSQPENFKELLNGIFDGFGRVIANMVNFAEPNVKDDKVPNVYCGIGILILAILYFTCKKIKARERICAGAVCLIFMLSFSIKWLDFIWHGFHFPNMIPYRYSFLFSFVLLVMAYRVFMNLDAIKMPHIIITLAVAFIFYGIIVDNLGQNITDEKIKKVVLFGAILIAFLTLMWVLMHTLEVVPKNAVVVALLIICIVEGACSLGYGVKKVGTTTADIYPNGTVHTQALADHIKELEEDNPEIIRSEVTKYSTLNDNALLGLNGISMFSSMINGNVAEYMSEFGLCGWPQSSRYTYQENSPVTNMFMNLKYMIQTNSTVSNPQLDKDHTTLIAKDESYELLENKYYLPLGFMVDEKLLDYKLTYAESKDTNPFENQNKFFRLATGETGDVYTSAGSYTTKRTDDEAQYTFTAPKDGTAYAYLSAYDVSNVEVKVNNSRRVENYSNFYRAPYIIMVGNVNKGDIITVVAKAGDNTTGSSINSTVYCYMLEDSVFVNGYNKLKSGSLVTTKSTDTTILGTVNAKEDGLFYTSIPYDKGWSAYVDGEEVEVTPVADSLVAFKVPAGQHDIKLKYMPHGFVAGTIITVLSLLIFAGLIVYSTNKEWVLGLFKKKEKIAVAENSENTEE